MIPYNRDAHDIYRRSFAIIRAEAELSRIPADLEALAVRVAHACGMPDVIDDLVFSPGAGEAGRAALAAGAAILCDSRMVAEGITRARLPASNPIVCTLNDPSVPALAKSLGTTRSAAAVELWRPRLAGSVVAIGNAPTALFHLLALLADVAGRVRAKSCAGPVAVGGMAPDQPADAPEGGEAAASEAGGGLLSRM